MRYLHVVILGLALLLAGCKEFSPEDVCERDGAIDTWISETAIRIEIINTANELSVSDIQDIYEAQTNQPTPTCLETAQEYAVESFRYQWEAAKVSAENDLTGSLSYLAKSAEASSQMVKEIERIAELNSWQR